MKLVSFAALALLSSSALAGGLNCTTVGDHTSCQEDKPLEVYPLVNKNAAMRKGIEAAQEPKGKVYLMKDANGRVCAYEIRGSVPVKLGCE